MTDKVRELYIKASLGYITTFLYFVMIGMIVLYTDFEQSHPEYALYILAIGAVINTIASTIIIRYGSINDLDISWHITRLAIAHTPTITALFVALIYLFL